MLNVKVLEDAILRWKLYSWGRIRPERKFERSSGGGEKRRKRRKAGEGNFVT